MYHPPSKRRQILKRIIVYGLMTTTVIVFVTLTIFYMLGYRFDGTDNTIEQDGLVQFVSKPSNAEVKIDGQGGTSKTPSKTSVTSGEHNFEISRSGYATWQKRVTIKAGTLTWLNYARLVPIQRPVSAIASFSTLDDTLASPDNKEFALLADKTK